MGFKSSRTRIWVVVVLFVLASMLVGCNRSMTKAEPTDEPEQGQTVEETPTQSMDTPTAVPADEEATTETTEGEGDQETPAEGEETTEPEATEVLTVEATEVPAAEATEEPATEEPAGELTYTIGEGDTLFTIAQSYGLTVEELAAYNGITDINQLEVGQVINIPAAGSEPPETTEPVAEETEPTGERIHVVQSGENLFRIALKYDLSFETVAAYNGIPWPYQIYPGEEIRIPPTE